MKNSAFLYFCVMSILQFYSFVFPLHPPKDGSRPALPYVNRYASGPPISEPNGTYLKQDAAGRTSPAFGYSPTDYLGKCEIYPRMGEKVSTRNARRAKGLRFLRRPFARCYATLVAQWQCDGYFSSIPEATSSATLSPSSERKIWMPKDSAVPGPVAVIRFPSTKTSLPAW